MDYNLLPNPQQIQTAMEAVKARGVAVELMENKAAALERLLAIIPPGSDVMTAGSTTLTQIGLDDLLISGRHPWRNLKGALLAEKDPMQQAVLRKQSSLADYFLGSVHAIAETGEIVVASATGSQLAPYAFSSAHILWVVGAQKITPTLEDALRRVREYVLPLEDRRMRSVTNNQRGSMIGKLLLFEKEAPYLKRTVTLLLVNEILGF
jgi:L-lactate utilization protein LutC